MTTLIATLTTVNLALPSTLTALNRYSPYRSKPNPCKSQKGLIYIAKGDGKKDNFNGFEVEEKIMYLKGISK
jgi:hypothetical protein